MGKTNNENDFRIGFKFVEKNADQQVVFGWLSESIDKNGVLVLDQQDDVIFPADLEKAAYDHVTESGLADAMHDGHAIGRLVESFFVSPDKVGKMGLAYDGSGPRVGWWVGYKIDDPAVWKRIKNGELGAFSIGGTGTREPYGD